MYEWAGQHEPLRILDDILSTTRNVEASYHVYGSFGDVYLQIALIKEKYLQDKEKNSNQKIGIFISPTYQQLASSTFWNDSNVFIWPVDNGVLNFIFNRLNLIGRHKNFPVRLLPTLYPLMAELINSGKLLYLDFMRNLIGSNCVGKISGIESLPQLNEARNILNENDISIGKTVLICADNNTHTEFPEAIWIEVIKTVQQSGWDICINDSGTIGKDGAKNLRLFGRDNGIKFLKVPPHLPISLTKLMGSYIGGSNGFITINAHFAEDTIGLHLINCLESENGFIKTPGGQLLKIVDIYSRNSARGCDQGTQTEMAIYSPADLSLLSQKITRMLSRVIPPISTDPTSPLI